MAYICIRYVKHKNGLEWRPENTGLIDISQIRNMAAALILADKS